MINPNDITGLILAGGRGSRMGGVDKGLQTFSGMPLALHTLTRLQMGGGVGSIMINANRNLAAYESFGASVWPDVLADYAGPLAGFLTGLERCETPFLVTVRPQPVFCLLRVELLESLVQFTQGGGRKIDAWTALHKTVLVPFDQPGDDPRAFCNANTLLELRQLENT